MLDGVYGVHIVVSQKQTPTPTTPTPPVASGRRPAGQVRHALIRAGLELARSGGPDAVVLREATRRVGVAPNAAYRHFADRDALLAVVCVEAMSILSVRMQAGIAAVKRRRDRKSTAIARLTAVGTAYFGFAHDEPGLFETAFAVPDHLEYATTSDDDAGQTPFQVLAGALDELVAVGVLPAERRPDAEYPVWSAVHGMAVLSARGPLRGAPDPTVEHLDSLVLAFITRAL